MAVTLRIAATAALVLVCLTGIGWEAGRWILHQQKGHLERETMDVILRGNPVVRTRFARSALERLALRHLYPLEIDLRLEAAAAYRLLGDFESARSEYLAALRVSDRPEIHIAFGDLLVERGETEAGLDHYVDAVEFSRYFARHLHFHAPEVMRRVREREREVAGESAHDRQ